MTETMLSKPAGKIGDGSAGGLRRHHVGVAFLPVLISTVSLFMPAPADAETVFQPAEVHPPGLVTDEPEAHAIYDAMVDAFRDARTLQYQVDLQWSTSSGPSAGSRYKVRLSRPNYFRVESYIGPVVKGVLIGDGRNLWIYWPGGRPALSGDVPGADPPPENEYMTKPAPIGRHSIGHEAAFIGVMPILDASIFHGYVDSLHPYMDGVRSLETETVDGQSCDVIELSFIHGQRTWKLWLADSDLLPRRVEETIRVADPVTRVERWTHVKVNEEIPADLFRWRPRMGWSRWRPQRPGAKLLKSGTRAPDFELMCADGTNRRLSDYRDKAVWLVFWRFG